MRLIAALWESESDRLEREEREERETAAHNRREEERRRLYEEDQRELAEISRRNRERYEKTGRRVLTPAEVAAHKAKRIQIINPTREQRMQATRKKYAPRSSYDQRREEEDDG